MSHNLARPTIYGSPSSSELTTTRGYRGHRYAQPIAGALLNWQHSLLSKNRIRAHRRETIARDPKRHLPKAEGIFSSLAPKPRNRAERSRILSGFQAMR